ncbi:MAG: hypothetical protein AABX82_04945 [Nanoarchaeota archaeon]
MTNITITFDEAFKKEILEIFDKNVDDDDFIVEAANPTQKVLTPHGEDIRLKEFVGIKKGSEIFIKGDLISLIDFTTENEDK